MFIFLDWMCFLINVLNNVCFIIVWLYRFVLMLLGNIILVIKLKRLEFLLVKGLVKVLMVFINVLMFLFFWESIVGVWLWCCVWILGVIFVIFFVCFERFVIFGVVRKNLFCVVWLRVIFISFLCIFIEWLICLSVWFVLSV